MILDLDRLFRAHQDELIARLRRMVGCGQTAADLVQDTYVRLLRMNDPEGIAHPRAFLHQTAVNLALGHLRKQRHRAPILTALDDASAVPFREPAASQSVYDKQRLSAFQIALDTLPFPTKEVLVYRRIHGHSHEEIARRLSLTKRQVENHLPKALYHCQNALPDGSAP